MPRTITVPWGAYLPRSNVTGPFFIDQTTDIPSHWKHCINALHETQVSRKAKDASILSQLSVQIDKEGAPTLLEPEALGPNIRYQIRDNRHPQSRNCRCHYYGGAAPLAAASFVFCLYKCFVNITSANGQIQQVYYLYNPIAILLRPFALDQNLAKLISQPVVHAMIRGEPCL